MKSIYFAFLIAFCFSSCSSDSTNDKLPIYGRREAVTKTVNGENVTDTSYHQIPNFSFVDQDNKEITPATFNDKIYVADFFFTTCPTICPIMKTQMLRVYEKFKDEDEVLLLSHSIDPVHDSVAVLKDFAERLGVKSNKWHFVTGNKDHIYEVGQKGYMVTATDDPNEPGGYLHSGAFILVDKGKKIRGIYDGTKEEEVDRLMRDIPKLLNEYKKADQ